MDDRRALNAMAKRIEEIGAEIGEVAKRLGPGCWPRCPGVLARMPRVDWNGVKGMRSFIATNTSKSMSNSPLMSSETTSLTSGPQSAGHGPIPEPWWKQPAPTRRSAAAGFVVLGFYSPDLTISVTGAWRSTVRWPGSRRPGRCACHATLEARRRRQGPQVSTACLAGTVWCPGTVFSAVRPCSVDCQARLATIRRAAGPRAAPPAPGPPGRTAPQPRRTAWPRQPPGRG